MLDKINKSTLKNISKLNQKKYRDLENKFIIEGNKIVNEALNSNWHIETLLIREDLESDLKIKNILKLASKKEIPSLLVQNKDFDRISDTVTSQGIAAVVHKKNAKLNQIIDEDIKLVVALEKISDPGNLGTILRICDWFAVDAVLISQGSADIYNPKVVRASMGSIFHLNIVENLEFEHSLKNLRNKGFYIFSTTLDGNNLYNSDYPDKIVLVFGNEADGISQGIIQLSDNKLTIPRYGNAESLNVASACAIILSDYKARKTKEGTK